MTYQLKLLPLSEMKVSTLNMRHSRKPPDISDIYPSIAARGVQQPLLVRREGKSWGVIAGQGAVRHHAAGRQRRRHRSLAA